MSERDYEFIFCDEVPLFISLNNQDFVVKTGDILIIPPSTKVTGFKRSSNPISSIGYILFLMGTYRLWIVALCRVYELPRY